LKHLKTFSVENKLGTRIDATRRASCAKRESPVVVMVQFDFCSDLFVLFSNYNLD
jgi:hypothetical protein